MTANEFRALALDLPGAEERSHMDHPDFRVGGKIFATLGPAEEWGMVKLTPEQQSVFVEAEPEAFEPVKGGWGLKGATKVNLDAAVEPGVVRALDTAWRNIAPRSLIDGYDRS
ncbi:MAG: MmcQ/YjbR family DNA-binding protein [Acidobacteriota bacterium]